MSAATARATTPSGRLIQNTQRQSTESVSQPPSSGPATAETPNTAPMGAMNFARSRAGTTSAMMVWDMIIRPEPPRPCKNRNPTNCSMVCEKPPARTRAGTARWRRGTAACGRRGHRPCRRRHGDRDGERVGRDGQLMCCSPSSSPTIVGSAVPTIVWSSEASSMTSIRLAKIQPMRGLAAAVVLTGSSVGGGEGAQGGPGRPRRAEGVGLPAVDPAGAADAGEGAGHGRDGPRRELVDVTARRTAAASACSLAAIRPADRAGVPGNRRRGA